jgi:NAD(P)-dependent dehydrogenase (short-subunit alcohol dehydrogenase family)
VENVEKLELDVLNDESVKAAVGTIMTREGRIDVLVNNAGVGCTGVSHRVTGGHIIFMLMPA